MTENINIYKLLKISMRLFMTLITLALFSVTAKAAFTLTASPAIMNSDTQINLNWTSVTNSVYYQVSRDNVLIANINIDTERNYLSYTDTDLTPQTSYNYTITAVNPQGDILQTATSSASTTQMKTPSIVSSHLDLNNKSLTLTWVNNSLSVKGTSVIKLGQGEITYLGNDGNSISFIDPTITPNTPVQYAVISYDGKGHSSPYSTAVTITPVQLPNINASLVNGVTTISWNSISNIQYFKLERSKYLQSSWSSWEVILPEIEFGTTSVTDQPPSDGTFRYRLSVNTNKFKGFSNISRPVTRLFSPSNLQCIPVSTGRIDLSWTNPPGNDYNLKIERKREISSNSSDFSTIAILDGNITDFSDTSNIELDTAYYYKITAFDSNSNTASTPEYYIYTGPPLPAQSLKADIISSTKVALNWEDVASNELGFIIEKRFNSEGFTKVANVPANITTYTDNTLTIENTYTYRVISYNPAGQAQSYSNEVSCSTSLLKEPPASLTAVPVSANQIILDWVYGEPSSYRTAIERKMGAAGSWEIVAALAAGFTSYSDSNLPPNTQFYYRVKTIIDNSVYSRPYPGTENGISGRTKLLKPQELKVVWSSASTIKLTWLDTSYGEARFIIERKSGDGPFVIAGTSSPDNGEWYDSGLEPGMSYTYRLKAATDDNSSDYTDETKVEGLLLPPPSNLNATVISSNEISLVWDDDSGIETGFTVEQSTGTDQNWNEIAVLKANTTNYSISGLEPDTLYRFRIKAHNIIYHLESNSEECEITIRALAPPSDLTVKAISSSQISLTWKDDSNGEQGFIIERKSLGSDFVEIARTDPNTTKFTDTNLRPNKEYYYKVKAYNGKLYTHYTNVGITITNAPKTFSDLDTVPWARTAIESLAERGIIKGKSTGQNVFSPNDRITRAEFISIVVIALQFNKTPTGTFEDVKPHHWFYRNVMIAKNIGMISGIGNNLFYPNEPIKREDMSVILARALKISGKPLPDHNKSILYKYTDINSISDYAISSMSALNGEKIITGKSSTLLAPKDYATRAEAAVILYKILNLV